MSRNDKAKGKNMRQRIMKRLMDKRRDDLSIPSGSLNPLDVVFMLSVGDAYTVVSELDWVHGGVLEDVRNRDTEAAHIYEACVMVSA